MRHTRDELDDELLAKAAAELLERPSDFGCWDDRLYNTHGPVYSWADRGDDVLAESNFHTILEHLQGVAGWAEHEDRDCCWDETGRKRGWGTDENPHDDDVFEGSVGHWLVGSMRQIYVRVYDTEGGYTDAFREAVAVMEALRDDYPVFDESDYSERAYAAWEKAYDMALDDAERRSDHETTDEEAQVIRDFIVLDEETRSRIWESTDVEEQGPDWQTVQDVWDETYERLIGEHGQQWADYAAELTREQYADQEPLPIG